jgi:hypothetical protein
MLDLMEIMKMKIGKRVLMLSRRINLLRYLCSLQGNLLLSNLFYFIIIISIK